MRGCARVALDGLLGFDLHQKTVGVVGIGKIGACFAAIMKGFGCTLLGSDPVENPECAALGLPFPNVVVTGHQAFFTVEALRAIAETTIDNVDAFVAIGAPRHPVSVEKLAG